MPTAKQEELIKAFKAILTAETCGSRVILLSNSKQVALTT